MRAGDVRPSQLITTFGPGAIVDLLDYSVVVRGIDDWEVGEEHRVAEPRLARALGVSEFYSPPAAESRFHATIPTSLFPNCLVCTKCRALGTIEDQTFRIDREKKWQVRVACRGVDEKCATARVIPAPLVLACSNGHLADFPWWSFVHESSGPCARPRLELVALSHTGSIGDLQVRCACGSRRTLSDAMSLSSKPRVLKRCPGARPWLNCDAEPCAVEPLVLQRGASNVWFPVVRSTLSLQDLDKGVQRAVDRISEFQRSKLTSRDELRDKWDMFESIQDYSIDEVWPVIERMNNSAPINEVELRWPEWQVLGGRRPIPQGNLDLERMPSVVPDELKDTVHAVTKIPRLVEVRALAGFTRVDYTRGWSDAVNQEEVVPIRDSSRTHWLPAVEVRGEGVFIELHEDKVSEWEMRAEVKSLTKSILASLGGTSGAVFPGPRLLLLHSLSHALLRQMALDCGYSNASIRERLYVCSESGRRMAGVLIYTASADSGGSLGGLVELAEPDRFRELILSALRGAEYCSSDPLCAESDPAELRRPNGAACHACMFAPESACERFNRMLDRSVLVPTMKQSACAYFERY